MVLKLSGLTVGSFRIDAADRLTFFSCPIPKDPIFQLKGDVADVLCQAVWDLKPRFQLYPNLEVFSKMDCFKDFEDDREFLSLREYARVTGYLPISIRAVTEAEKLSLVSRMVLESVCVETQPLPEIEDEALSSFLKILNSKLDSIIRILSGESCGKGLDMAKVNISDGGLRIHAPDSYERNSDVEVKLMVPTAPSMVFYIYGKVVSCEPAGDMSELCIEFTDIDNDIREHIAKYVFHKQRELIRKKRSRTP